MPYEISWLADNRILSLRVWDNFSEDELIQSAREMRERMDSGQSPIHIICDASGVKNYAKNMRAIKDSAQHYFNHPSLGWFVLLGFNQPIMRFFSNTIMQLLMRNFKHAETIEEALAIIHHVDPTTVQSG